MIDFVFVGYENWGLDFIVVELRYFDFISMTLDPVSSITYVVLYDELKKKNIINFLMKEKKKRKTRTERPNYCY